jgi:hypothetical protein
MANNKMMMIALPLGSCWHMTRAWQNMTKNNNNDNDNDNDDIDIDIDNNNADDHGFLTR